MTMTSLSILSFTATAAVFFRLLLLHKAMKEAL
jgi:hypothetical protein